MLRGFQYAHLMRRFPCESAWLACSKHLRGWIGEQASTGKVYIFFSTTTHQEIVNWFTKSLRMFLWLLRYLV